MTMNSMAKSFNLCFSFDAKCLYEKVFQVECLFSFGDPCPCGVYLISFAFHASIDNLPDSKEINPKTFFASFQHGPTEELNWQLVEF